MADTQTIREAFERNERILSEKPSVGLKTGSVRVRMRDGLACDIEAGPWKLRTDMSREVGGEETGPKPGQLVGAGLGSCLAVMVGLWAAKLGVQVNDVEIEVEFDADTRVLFGVGDIPARWKAIRYRVRVESDAPEEDVMRVLDLAHKWSHVRGDLEHAFTIDRQVEIAAPAA